MAIKKRHISPRQKMINLMYVVLMAMLALNVSTEVLDGFAVVDDSLRRTTANATQENEIIYKAMDAQMQVNPTKTKQWHEKAREVRTAADNLYNLAYTLKVAIAREADGENADVLLTLDHKDDLEAASQVMLTPGKGRGRELEEAINDFRERMISMVSDPIKKRTIRENLSTEVPATSDKKQWTEYMFESMPAIAAMTMLTKLQSDVRYAEGEVLHSLLANIDQNDMRVNALDAFVIPSARTIVQGNKFSAQIVMAAVDTTKIPEVYVGEKQVALQNGRYETVCSRTGDFTLKGYLLATDANGEQIKREFAQPYSVVEPTATVSAEMMNMLYAGYNNPIAVSVPGVPLGQVTLSMTGGTLTQSAPGKYIAKPSTAGKTCEFTVYSSASGVKQQMGQFSFRVRRLPEPTPYIDLKDEKGSNRYHGGAVAKSSLLAADGIGAAIDDGLLDIPFRVLSFETVMFDGMGNAIPMASNGALFSERQKTSIRKMSRNRRLYVSNIRAIGPDGIERKLNSSMELIIR